MPSAVSDKSLSEIYYKSIYRGIGVGIAVIKVSGGKHFHYFGINPAMEKLIGVKSPDVKGKTPAWLTSLVGEKVVQETLADFRACIETRREVVRRAEVFLRGKSRWYIRKLEPVFDSARKVVGIISFVMDETESSQTKQALALMEMALSDSKQKLQIQNESLEKKNIALQELLEQVEIEKKKIKDNVLSNVETVLFPLIEKLKTGKVSAKYTSLLKSVVQDLASSYGHKMSSAGNRLSPRELEISNMIKNNLTSKEIAAILKLSLETVERHRANIRTKLEIVRQDVNLTSYLKNL